MKQPGKILIFQTAFLGDVILTLPLVQVLKRTFPHCEIDFLAIPGASEVLRNHPSIHEILQYDKRGGQRGLAGILSIAHMIQARRYDVALIPHRSLRSALVVVMSRIPVRAGFTNSAGRVFFTDVVQYHKDHHEVERNLSFMQLFEVGGSSKELPSLYPSQFDVTVVDKFLAENKIHPSDKLVAVAPGSVWNTKRWPVGRFTELVTLVARSGSKVVLVGGGEDEGLCSGIRDSFGADDVISAAGKFTVLQSSELLKRCKALISNDSAPMHMAVAMRTPVVAIFGATVPSFGFAPYGEGDIVVETMGLPCRPCSIHGGDKCPIGTLECMTKISAETVYQKLIMLQDAK